MLISVLTVCCILTFPAGCAKDEVPSEAARHLTSGKWIPLHAGRDLDNDGRLSAAEREPMPVCEADNRSTFQPSGVLLVEDLDVSCAPSTFTGQRWQLADRDTTLWIQSISGPNLAVTVGYQLLGLTDRTLTLRMQMAASQVIFELGRP